jgi:hypothetical protein
MRSSNVATWPLDASAEADPIHATARMPSALVDIFPAADDFIGHSSIAGHASAAIVGLERLWGRPEVEQITVLATAPRSEFT